MTDNEQDEQFYRDTESIAFPKLNDHQLSLLEPLGERRVMKRGEVLFKEGDQPDGLYLIRRGSVMISRVIAGREVVLSYLSAGNYVGEMALLTGAPRNATVLATQPTDALAIAKGDMAKLLANFPELQAGLRSLAQRRGGQ